MRAQWKDRLVFAFQPHQSHFLAAPESVILLPDDVSPEAAVFLPNMETAVSLVMDGQPVIGERVGVWGLGVVGLLASRLLVSFPLAQLYTFDPLEWRRAAAEKWAGVTADRSPKNFA
jgi:threonine dehydrogenase-like Zn-dependent dehydrogenase